MKLKKYLIYTVFVAFFTQLNQPIIAQESIVFSVDGKYGVKDLDDNLLIPPLYDKLGWSAGIQVPKGNVIGYYREGWGLLSLKNKVLTDPEYSSLSPLGDQLIIAAIKTAKEGKELFGLIDDKGKAILDIKYLDIMAQSDRLILIDSKSNGHLKYSLYDQQKRKNVSAGFYDLRVFSEGLFVFENELGLQGLVNRNGEIVLDAELDEIGVVESGFSRVDKRGSIGLIAHNGKVIMEPVHKFVLDQVNAKDFKKYELRSSLNELISSYSSDSVNQNANGFIEVYRNGHLTIFNSSGDQILVVPDVSEVYVTKSCFVVKTSLGVRLYDLDGKPIGDECYEDLAMNNSPDQKLIALKNNGLWGYVNGLGTLVIPFDYDKATPFFGDIATVVDGGRNRLINQLGQSIGRGIYDSISIQSNNTAIGILRGRTDLIDARGAILYQTYGKMKAHSLGFQTTMDDEKFGLITKYGEVIFNEMHYKISEVVNNKYLVVRTSGKLGLTLLDGTWSYWLLGDYQDMDAVTDEFIGIQRNDQWGFINYQKQLLIANRYDGIRAFQKNGLSAVKINDAWGFIDKKENLIVQPSFEEIGKFENGAAIAMHKQKYGLINASGELLTKIIYDRLEPEGVFGYVASIDGKMGLINHKGEQTIPITFSGLQFLNDGNCIVIRRGQYGVISASGVYVIPLKYLSITLTDSGNYLCEIL